jgi:hypothetical protein
MEILERFRVFSMNNSVFGFWHISRGICRIPEGDRLGTNGIVHKFKPSHTPNHCTPETKAFHFYHNSVKMKNSRVEGERNNFLHHPNVFHL